MNDQARVPFWFFFSPVASCEQYFMRRASLEGMSLHYRYACRQPVCSYNVQQAYNVSHSFDILLIPARRRGQVRAGQDTGQLLLWQRGRHGAPGHERVHGAPHRLQAHRLAAWCAARAPVPLPCQRNDLMLLCSPAGCHDRRWSQRRTAACQVMSVMWALFMECAFVLMQLQIS